MQLSRYRPASYAGKLKDNRARNFYSQMRVPHRNKARHPQWIVSRALLIFNNQAICSASKFIYNYSNPVLTVNAAAFIFSVQLHVQSYRNSSAKMFCQRLIVRAVVQHSAFQHSKNPPQAGYFFLPARDFRRVAHCAASFMWPVCRVIHQSCAPAYLPQSSHILFCRVLSLRLRRCHRLFPLRISPPSHPAVHFIFHRHDVLDPDRLT